LICWDLCSTFADSNKAINGKIRVGKDNRNLQILTVIKGGRAGEKGGSSGNWGPIQRFVEDQTLIKLGRWQTSLKTKKVNQSKRNLKACILTSRFNVWKLYTCQEKFVLKIHEVIPSQKKGAWVVAWKSHEHIIKYIWLHKFTLGINLCHQRPRESLSILTLLNVGKYVMSNFKYYMLHKPVKNFKYDKKQKLVGSRLNRKQQGLPLSTHQNFMFTGWEHGWKVF
jgi:hypothetical protein